MRLRTIPVSLDRPSLRQRALDYVELAKPRLIVMVLVVAFVGFYMGAPGAIEWWPLLHLLCGIALAAGGTLALNAYIEREADALMHRTQSRPLPEGRIQPLAALCFGVVTTCLGLLYLAYVVQPLSAVVTGAIVGSYLFCYTPMKMRTWWCSLIGAVPGALPPVAGWVAARGSIGVEALALFAIVFLWQMPHSLAIAWMYREDYARAGFQILPVLDPAGQSTGRQVVGYCVALLAAGALPTLLGMTGLVSCLVVLALGLMFLAYGINLTRSYTAAAARQLLHASLVYLPLTFLFMALDKLPPM